MEFFKEKYSLCVDDINNTKFKINSVSSFIYNYKLNDNIYFHDKKLFDRGYHIRRLKVEINEKILKMKLPNARYYLIDKIICSCDEFGNYPIIT